MTIDPDVYRAIYGRDPGPRSVAANPLPGLQKIAPEAAVQGLQEQRRTGIDAILAAESLPQLKQERDQVNWDALVQRSPRTAQLMSDKPAAAAAAREDMPVMTQIADAVGSMAAFVLGAAPGGGLPGFIGRTGRAIASGAPSAGAGLYGVAAAPFGMVGATGIESALLARQRDARGVADRLMPDMDRDAGNIERGYFSGLQSLGSNALLLPMALLPGGANAALTGMASQVGGASYGKGREAGLSPAQSLVYGASDAVVEFGTERFALMPMLAGIKAGAPLWKTLLATMAREIPGEQLATVLQDLNEWAAINPEGTMADYIAARPDAAVQTLVATIVGTGGQVTLMQGVQRAMDKAAGMDRQAQFAESQQQAMLELAKLAEATQVRQRDPETAAEFFQTLTEEQVPELYADARLLFQSGMTRQELEAAAGVEAGARFEEALQTGGDVVISTGEFLARAPGSAALPTLLEHLRTAPDAMSAAEGKAWMAERGEALQAEMAQAAEAALADEAGRAELDEIRGQLTAELQAAGRTGNVAEAYANLVVARTATRAAQLGMTPAELWEKQGLSVRAQGVMDGRALEQGAFHGTPHNVDRFSVQKIGTGEGAQAYGWGLYFAGKRDVAEHYRKTLSDDASVTGAVLVDGQKIDAFSPEGHAARLLFYNDQREMRALAKQMLKDSANAEPYAVDTAQKAGMTASEYYGRLNSFIATRTKKNVKVIKGNLYAVEIPEDGDMLDYDKSIGAQSAAIKEKLKASGILKDWKESRSDYSLPQEVRPDRGGALYALLSHKLGGDQAASQYLKGLGILGMKYKAGQIGGARGGGSNYVVWDDAAIGEPRSLYQGPRAFFQPDTNTVTLLQGADLSSFLHESGHYFFENDIALAAEIVRQRRDGGTITDGEQRLLDDVQAMMRHHGLMGDIDMQLTEWYSMDFEMQRAAHERTAESFEAYLFTGKAPSLDLQRHFEHFRAWLVNVYKSLKDFLKRHPEAGKLTDEVRGVFDRMLASEEAIAEAQAARAMGPLFETAARAGMTPEQWAQYQALGDAATGQAIADLQQRGMRDMRLLANARSRRLKELQSAMAGLRREVRMDATAEVMAQPIYRAWGFLTRKIGADDKLAPPPKGSGQALDVTRDSLLVAIAKLGGINRESAARDLGVAADDLKAKVQVFGASSVFRKDGGRTADDMRETLTELGYLRQFDEHGRTEIVELEDLVAAELRGDEQYSAAYDYGARSEAQEATRVINPEALDAGRLDLAGLKSLGLPDEIVQALQARKMTARDGLMPDMVAEIHGFTSGDHLVQALAAAEPPTAVIEARTDEMMLQRHGDMATPDGMQRAVDAALHGEARAKMIAAELDALNAAQPKEKAANGRGTVDVLARAAADYARQVMAQLRVRDVRPDRYQAAEARAAREADKAFRGGKTQEAAEAKRRQLIQHATAAEAIRVRAEMDKARVYLRKLADRPKSIHPDYLDQIDAMLERADLKQRSDKANDKRASFSTWVQEQLAQGSIPDFSESLLSPVELRRYKADLARLTDTGDPVLDDDAKISARLAEGIERSETTPFRDMTVEQVRGLVDAAKQVAHLGKLKKGLLANRERRAYEAVRDEIVASVRENGGKAKPKQQQRTRSDALGKAWQNVVAFGASHMKASTWARLIDGGKDNGPFWRHVVRGANEQASWESTQRSEATQQLHALLAPALKSVSMLDMTGRGRFFASINDSLNFQERFALALNVGNEGNLQRLLDGNGWTQAQIEPVLRSLTADQWRAVQQVWAFFESYRPQVGALEKRTTGREPEWVQAMPRNVQTSDGLTITLRGGYYPVRYDSRQSARAEANQTAEEAKAMMQAAHNAATTRRNFVKPRAEQVKGRPLLLNLQGLYAGVSDVIHDLAWREWLMDTGKILRSDAVQTAVRDHWGPDVMREFRKWTEDIAVGQRRTDHGLERVAGFVRQNVSMAALTYSFMTAALQFTGYVNSAARVGNVAVARATAAYFGAPRRMTREAMASSEFLRNRTRTRFRELNELRNRVEGQTTVKEVMGRYGYWMMMKCQLMVDVPTWWAAHDKALEQGLDEDSAVALADQAVKDAQGGGEEVDLSGIERGGPLVKLFTGFYSYMGSTLNTAVLTGMSPQSHAKKTVDLMMLLSVPAIGTALLKSLLTPGGADEDPEELAKRLAAEQLSFMFGLVMFGREFSFIGKQVFGEHAFPYRGPSGLRMIGDVQALGTQTMQGEFDIAFAKAFVNVLGDFTGIPSVQINRSITGAAAIADGEVDGPIDSARALAFGFERTY